MPLNKTALMRYRVIDECIKNQYKPYPTIEYIRDKCIEKLDLKGISISMVQKDIAAMKESGLYEAPIKYSRKENGYYYANPEFSIDKVPLKSDEIEALELAAGMIRRYKGTQVGGSFNMALDKVISWLKSGKHSDKGHTHDIIFPEKLLYFKGSERIDQLIHCIIEKIPVSFIHYSYKEQSFKSCVVHPYFLKEHRSRWYLAGHSEFHGGIRIFGLDRIEDVIMLKKKYIETPDLQPEEMFRHSIGTFVSKGCKIPEIIIEFNHRVAGFIKTQPLHESQEISDYLPNGGIIVKLKVNPDEEFYQMLLSYGSNSIVLSPESIRKEAETRHRAASVKSSQYSQRKSIINEIRKNQRSKRNNP